MLKKRIIGCFDIKNGRVVKGIRFEGLADAGDPVQLVSAYSKSGIDELVFLDIAATNEKRSTLVDLVVKMSAEINIPFTVGGGINSVEEAEILIRNGADKVSLNTSAIKNPELISKLTSQFGSQAVVVAIDVRQVDQDWKVFTNGGTQPANLDAIEWAKKAESLGAGEILLTSMNNDGTKNGFALEITRAITNAVNIPVIASGGAGTMEHFKQVFVQTDASAALAAGIFHFGEVGIQPLKDYLKTEKIPVR